MTGKKLAKLAAKYRELVGDAIANGEEIPHLEAVFGLEQRKLIKRHFGDDEATVVENLLTDLEEYRDAAQEAIETLDACVDTIEVLGTGFQAVADLAEAREQSIVALAPVREGDEPDVEIEGKRVGTE